MNFGPYNCQPIFRIFFILALTVFSCKPKVSESTSENIVENEGLNTLTDPIDFDLDKILERDTLKVIVDNSSTSYFLYKGKPMGFEYELLERLAKDLGVSLKLIITVNLEATFDKLNRGEADIIAYPLTITRERKKIANFTINHYTVREVLVQRKPENWRDMKAHEIEKSLIRNQVDLIGKEVYVRKSSSYLQRLRHLSEESVCAIYDFIEYGDEYEDLIKSVKIWEKDKYHVPPKDSHDAGARKYIQHRLTKKVVKGEVVPK